MNDQIRLRKAGLQDVDAGALKTAIPEPLARTTEHYLVEYGIRLDDSAMVFHFFPRDGGWEESWRMDARLETAIAATLDTSRVSAGYVPELNSFYVIVGGLGSVPDPWLAVLRFFRVLDDEPAGVA